MTDKQRELMLHALGLTRSKESYRNYFAADPEGEDREEWDNLVARGLAMHNPHALEEAQSLRFYHVTDAGIELLKGSR